MNRQNSKSKFDLVKDNDEQILWENKPEFIPFILVGLYQILSGLIIPGVILIINYFGDFDRNMDSGYWFLMVVFIAPIISGLYQIFYNIFNYSNTSFALTNKRVMFSSGYSFVDFKTIDLDKILELETKTNFIDNIFKVGTIRFFSGRTKSDEGNTTKLYDEWSSIKEVLSIYKMVKQVSSDFQDSNTSKLGTKPSNRQKDN
ncbi:PH domain-containing protein [Flammeovirga agarivorans]|uniref:PH domain-containing protein n=1 Tax=Flammeovirga agarivorans TaxID=2726742 RepID=A0A7X8SPT2_9BACT|nr:PH domain-containing protein [Flammeovirga agarivorans]NLR94103.1 PH domain-containing protein [Flammeovirga agarivorans]